MKISMMSYTMARGLPAGQTLDVAGLCAFTRELDLDAVDWVTTYGHEPAQVRRIMDDHGLLTCCHTFSCDLNHPTPDARAAGRDAFKRGIEAAVALGTDKVMLPVGGSPDLPREQSFRNVMDGLAEVIAFADEAGVITTVENFPAASSPFVVSADVNRAVAELPQLRVTYDNGNVTTGGEAAADGFTNSAAYIVHAHFKDWALCGETDPGARLCLDGKHRRAVLVGDGDVDQVGSLRAMKAAGYAGYINFEYEGSEYTPREATIEGVRRMREMMAGLN